VQSAAGLLAIPLKQNYFYQFLRLQKLMLAESPAGFMTRFGYEETE
jgi:hypothetical protein